MVNVKFGASTKDLWVLEDVYPESEAERIVNAKKTQIFGVVSGLMKAFSKQKGVIQITAKQKRYEPFWHVEGRSTFEYKRKTQYSFPVKPEVIGVTINNKEFKVAEGEPLIPFVGDDHCFEQVEKKIIESAVTGETKGLDFYLKAKKNKIKSPDELLATGEVVPIKNRASYLVSRIVKDVLKPIHADVILDENVEITQLDLYFRPVYTFELLETDTKRKKYVELDAVTGAVEKVNTWTQGLKEKAREMSWFDIGADISGEIAGNFIPGAGFAAMGASFLKGKYEKSKAVKSSKKIQQAYAARKKEKKKR